MVRNPNEALDVQKSITLKLNEPVVDSDNPWADDLLARQPIAIRLTNLVATQELPLTVSLHGQWGTGKTFMLRRWQRTLEQENFSAIYFNAWEDDFYDDPLVAIVGQLSEYFDEHSLKGLVSNVAKVALPLIRRYVLGVLEKHTGLSLTLSQNDETSQDPLQSYLSQRTSKAELKRHLTDLAAKVQKETGHPLVFIIDELDRCRPTFAIELLERVKHIFDVPNLVFVFGLNRDELSKSLSSVYGDIDTDVYLRRFFDFEFNLPEADSQGFAVSLIDKFQLGDVFRSLSNATGNPYHIYDYDNYRQVVPNLWSALGLSLRDIDYGVRLLALLARNVAVGAFTHPFLLAFLIAMKFKKPEFYRSLISGDFRTSEIMNYIDDTVREDLSDRSLPVNLDRIEGFLYCTDSANSQRQERGEIGLAELEQVQVVDDSSETSFSVISRRARNADERQLHRIKQAVLDGRNLFIGSGNVLGNLAALIDIYQTQLRR